MMCCHLMACIHKRREFGGKLQMERSDIGKAKSKQQKMNWGIRIVIALALFIALITAFGVYMVTTDTDSLVAEDYYERGLNYDRLRAVDSVQQTQDSVRATLK